MAGQVRDILAEIEANYAKLTPKLRGIADYVRSEPESFIRLTSREICAALGTSEPTLIRFCKDFGYSGLAEFRIDLALALAGASGSEPRFIEPVLQDRRTINLESKRRIARAAAPLIAGDKAILIDNGSTVDLLAALLDKADPLTVMTTDLNVAQTLMGHGRHDVMLTGGRIRPNARSLTGRLVESSLAGMRFDTFIMGATSLDPINGLSTFREDEAHQTRAMSQAAERVIVLADRSKFMKPSLHRICTWEEIDVLVTDLDPEDPVATTIADLGVQLVFAKDKEAAE